MFNLSEFGTGFGFQRIDHFVVLGLGSLLLEILV